MFEIGFSELILVTIVGLVVLGPERLPVAIKTVAGWIRTMRSLASSVQNELTQQLKLQELQDSLKKVENSALKDLTPELKASMDELKAAAQAMQKSYQPGQSAAAVDDDRQAASAQINKPQEVDDRSLPNAHASDNSGTVNLANNEPVRAVNSADNSPQSDDSR